MKLKVFATVAAVSVFLLPRTISAVLDPISLIAIGTVSGAYEDFATPTAGLLENHVPGNRLGGLGSGLAHAGGNIFIALPDRGPNAVPFNSCIDDTVSYINRFQTFHLSLAPIAPTDPPSPLPFTLTPMLIGTTLLSSTTPLVYGTGSAGCPTIGDGAPVLNALHHTHYFTGRSDNFDPSHLSNDPHDGRLDTESVRVSNDGLSVFVTDEYGPYVYQFERFTGRRIRWYKLPDMFAVSNLSPVSNTEIGGNTSGRVANKGMEGLAITPDGQTLVGIMQSPLLQDGGTNGSITRIVTIDVRTGHTHQYAYQFDNIGSAGSPKYGTASEIVALNDHAFLVDERDGKGRGDTPTASNAVQKKLYEIDLTGAPDVSGLTTEAHLLGKQVPKNLFLDIVAVLNANGIDSKHIPAKIEGMAFGQDVMLGGVQKHTLYVSNDNDFLATVPFTSTTVVDNPNQFFVFAFDDSDLLYGHFEAQNFRRDDDDHDHGHDHGRDDFDGPFGHGFFGLFDGHHGFDWFK